MTCPICDWMDAEKNIIYQDKFVVVFLHPSPVVEGHVVVAPRQHFPIMEQVPDAVLEHMYIVANRVSTSVFEMLGAKGTNILVHNGISAGQEIAHFVVNVIPRKENDGLNFRWAPRQLDQQGFEALAAKIKDRCDYIGHSVPEEKPVEVGKVSEVPSDDLRLKQFDRVP